jgi:hypothetical protein
MNTNEILTCLKQDKKIAPDLLGVYPRDKLPRRTFFPCGLVANTDTSTGPGEHWVAMYFPSRESAIYFDSYGLPPKKKEFLRRCQGKHVVQYKFNDVQLQSPLSSTCGQYTVFFLYKMCRGYSLKQIQDSFVKMNLHENDAVVTEFINRNYNVKTSVYDDDFIVKQICNLMKDVK